MIFKNETLLSLTECIHFFFSRSYSALRQCFAQSDFWEMVLLKVVTPYDPRFVTCHKESYFRLKLELFVSLVLAISLLGTLELWLMQHELLKYCLLEIRVVPVLWFIDLLMHVNWVHFVALCVKWWPMFLQRNWTKNIF